MHVSWTKFVVWYNMFFNPRAKYFKILIFSKELFIDYIIR